MAVVSIMVVVVLAYFLLKPSPAEHADQITVHCAAGLVPAIKPAAEQYEKEFGVHINFEKASSGALLSKIKLKPTGDLYIPADRMFISLVHEADFARETVTLAKFRLCIAVQPGNPKNIQSLDDLLREDVQFGMTVENAAAGAKAKQMLMPINKWKDIQSDARVTKPTVTEVAQDVQTESVDAALVWDSTAKQFGLDVIEIPEFADAWGWIDATVLTSSERPTDAIRFARYLAAPDKGQVSFSENHYVPFNGDQWAVRPTLIVFSGGVNRPAVRQTIDDFKQREDVEIEITYNGCGVLISQMQIDGKWPDVYFACDVSFSKQVAEEFDPFVNVSRMEIGILVPPGNPKNIQTLEDLTADGVKVGRAHEELGALGKLTRDLLVAAGVYDRISKNFKVTSPTAAELVAQIDLLDAAIVYRANAHDSVQKGKAEFIPIDHPLAIATQPIAARKGTRYPHTTQRLIDAIQSAESRSRFEGVGFEWIAEDQP